MSTKNPTTPPKDELSKLVQKAQQGDRIALEQVVTALQDDIYGLAMRMLDNVEDAKDAMQEVMVKVVTRLGGFQRKSSIRTWAYRIAANHIINIQKRAPRERAEGNLEQVGAFLDEQIRLSRNMEPSTNAVLVKEVKLFCTQGMLLCLPREQRFAYIVGAILGLSSSESAAILEVPEATFRKRLSRAKTSLEEFMKVRCGLVDKQNDCRCAKLTPRAVELGLVDPDKPFRATHPIRNPSTLQKNIEQLRTAVEVFRSHPNYAAPEDFSKAVRQALDLTDFDSAEQTKLN